MNNCPKCGNPLQAGVNSCPICGTNIDVNKTVSNDEQKNKTNTVTVTSVAKPVDSVEKSVSTNVQPTVESANLSTSKAQVQTEVQEVKTEEKAIYSSNQNDGTSVSQSTTPVSNQAVVNQPTSQVTQEQPQVVISQPSSTPVQQPATQQPVAPQPVQATVAQQPVQATVAPQPIQPTVVPSQPATSIPLSLEVNDPAAIQAVKTISAELKPELKPAPKKKTNKNVILIAVVLVILLVAGGLYFMQNNSSKMQNPNSQKPNTDIIANTSVSSNGYKFSLPDGWLINEDGKNVILTNTSETVVIKLDHSSSNLSNISKGMIEQYLSNSSFEKTEVSEIQISAKDAYVINTNINDLPVQIYFIGGGSNLIIGVTIIYQSEDTKTKYEASITEMLGTLSFSDESIKAISTIDMYSDIFNVYGGIINSQRSSNNDENNQPVTENPTPENGETQPEIPTE